MVNDLGEQIAKARRRRGMSQGALAAELSVTQQTVSRWENGTARPRGRAFAALRHSLGLATVGTRAASDEPANAAGSETDPTLPVRPLEQTLPLGALGDEVFEAFVADLLHRLFPGASVHRLGGGGDDQRGYDITVAHADGTKLAVQCKREKQFGPAKVLAAVNAAELRVDRSIVALARVATSAARFEMERHSGWDLWDQADISRHVRQLPDESSLHLVRTYFPSHVEAFLGIKPAGPWMSRLQFYRDGPSALLSHRQPLVGREQLAGELATWVGDDSASQIAVLYGRGGLGKSKLIWDLALGCEPDIEFRFLGLGQVPTPSDYEILPRDDRLVVVIDDDDQHQQIASIAAQLANHRPRAKLLISSRPYGENNLNLQFWKLGQTPDHMQRWTLEDLPPEEACDLAAALIDRPIIDPLTRQLALISADCPLIAIIAADLLRSGDLSNAATFDSSATLRTAILTKFSEITTLRGASADIAKRRRLLASIAAFQPVRLNDPDFERAILSVTGGHSWDDINGEIRDLEDAGLVLRRGDSVRVVPDMLGEILLSQAAYDDRQGRATTFVARAQAHAVHSALEHLVFNTSRMEWQVTRGTSTEVELIDDLWFTLERAILDETYGRQVELLSLVSRAAQYQPARAMRVVRGVLQATDVDKSAPTEAAPWSYKRADIVRGLAPVLRRVAFHFDYLEEAANILWDLAQSDNGRINQNPNHPLRILQQLAALQLGKPLAYTAALVDAAESWLTTTSPHSPFDVIDVTLSTEIRDEIFSGNKLLMYSYPVKSSSVGALRSRVIHLAAGEAHRLKLPKAVRAVRVLEKAIRVPNGREVTLEERSDWFSEFIPTINILGSLLADATLDPTVRLAAREALWWHAEYGEGETKSAAETALSGMVRSFGDELALCLHDGWGRSFRTRHMNYEDAGRMRQTEFARVANLLAKDKTAGETLEHLSMRLVAEQQAFGSAGSATQFIWVLFSSHIEVAVELCMGLRNGGYSHLMKFASIALGAIASAGDVRAVAIGRSFIDGGSPELLRLAAEGFANGRGREGLLPGELSLLRELLATDDEAVTASICYAIYGLAHLDGPVALDLLAGVNFGQSGKLAAEALAVFGPNGPLNWEETADEFRESILTKLLECNSLDEYELMMSLATLSKLDTGRVVGLFLQRIDRQHSVGSSGYDAIPAHWDPPLEVRDTDMLRRRLTDVRDAMDGTEDSGAIDADRARLFAMLAVEWEPESLAVASDTADATSSVEVVARARLFSSAPLNIMLENAEMLLSILRLGSTFGQDAADLILYSLLPTRSFSVSFSSEPSEEDVERLARVRSMADKLPVGSIERRYFSELAERLQVQMSLFSRPEHAHDARDW